MAVDDVSDPATISVALSAAISSSPKPDPVSGSLAAAMLANRSPDCAALSEGAAERRLLSSAAGPLPPPPYCLSSRSLTTRRTNLTKRSRATMASLNSTWRSSRREADRKGAWIRAPMRTLLRSMASTT